VSQQKAEYMNSKETSANGRPHPILVGIYGSSLFLTAVAAALREHTAVLLIHFLNAPAAPSILRQLPAVLVWQTNSPPKDIALLLQAGLWLLEVDEQQSCVTIQHSSRNSEQTLPIQQSNDLITWIIQATQNGVIS
jgi:hypothetical protein